MIKLERKGATSEDIKKYLKKITDYRPMLKDIGQNLEASAKLRFRDSVDPDGKKWAPRSEATKAILRSMGKLGPRILVVDGFLRKSISYSYDDKEVNVGTNVEYAKINQEGGFTTFNGRQVEIPQRRFLGISKKDQRVIDDIIKRFLQNA